VKTRAVVAQTRAELALTLRRGESLIVTLAVPLGILVFFAKVDAITPTTRSRSTSWCRACSRSR
jgi:ABC-2 type transport system permease protein